MIGNKAVSGWMRGRERSQRTGILKSATYGRTKLFYVVLDIKVAVLRTVAPEVRGEWRYTVLLYEREGPRGERRL
jgi:hypothetical protein